MLPDELLRQLPTLQELSDHPRVRKLTERWGRSSLVVQLRGALDEVGSEITKRSEAWREVTRGDLVDRVLKVFDRSVGSPEVEIINGTGTLCGSDPVLRVPIAEVALAHLGEHSSRFRRSSDESLAAATLCQLAHAEGALVAVSYEAAHAALLQGLAASSPGGRLVVGRPDVTTIGSGMLLPDLCQAHGVSLVEVGASDHVCSEEYARALSEHPGSTVLVGTHSLALGIGIEEVASVVASDRGKLVAALADAPPCDLADRLDMAYATAESACRAGADVVLLRGAGMTGGPDSGLIVGRRSSIDPITRAARTMHWQAGDATESLLQATLELFARPDDLPFMHPLCGLLDTSLENLRTRAERLAPLIGASRQDLGAEARRLEGQRVGDGLRPIDSWGIELVSPTLSIDALEREIQGKRPQLLSQRKEDRLLVDLRMVAPSEEKALLEILAGV